MTSKDRITLWTVQPVEIWQALHRESALRVDPERVDQDFRRAYDWLRGELSQRIDGYRGGYPWWAYYRTSPRQRPKAGCEQVRLKLSVPRERVELHEASAWLCVMNDWFVAWIATRRTRSSSGTMPRAIPARLTWR
jgi:hypothetical protein